MASTHRSILHVVPREIETVVGQPLVRLTDLEEDYVQRMVRTTPGLMRWITEDRLTTINDLVMMDEPYMLASYLQKHNDHLQPWTRKEHGKTVPAGHWLHGSLAEKSLTRQYGSDRYDSIVVYMTTRAVHAHRIAGLTIPRYSYIQYNDDTARKHYGSGQASGVVPHEYLHQVEREHDKANVPFPFSLHVAEDYGFESDDILEWYPWYDWWADHAQWDTLPPPKPIPTPHPKAERLDRITVTPETMWDVRLPGLGYAPGREPVQPEVPDPPVVIPSRPVRPPRGPVDPPPTVPPPTPDDPAPPPPDRPPRSRFVPVTRPQPEDTPTPPRTPREPRDRTRPTDDAPRDDTPRPTRTSRRRGQ